MDNPGTAARRQPPHRGQVLRTDWLNPRMIRVVLGGDGLAAFVDRGYTDQYIKLHFPRPSVTHPDHSAPATARGELPPAQRPLTRTFTMRHWDPDRRELTIDFVYHGESGVAGAWAARARPGDLLHFGGPGGGYAPAAEADWHLLAGDESALPAIAAAVEAMPQDAQGTAFVEVTDSADEQDLQSPTGVDLVWLHRGSGRIGDQLAKAVTGTKLPTGQVQAFVHGEAHFVRSLRGHLLEECGLDRSWISISGYWRRGADEDGWQATKHEWN